MPNIINGRSSHKSVAVKNKLFIIGGMFTKNCEVFYSTTNEFSLLKQHTLASGLDLYKPYGVITIGSKIFIFQDNSTVKTYDFKNNELSLKKCQLQKV